MSDGRPEGRSGDVGPLTWSVGPRPTRGWVVYTWDFPGYRLSEGGGEFFCSVRWWRTGRTGWGTSGEEHNTGLRRRHRFLGFLRPLCILGTYSHESHYL